MWMGACSVSDLMAGVEPPPTSGIPSTIEHDKTQQIYRLVPDTRCQRLLAKQYGDQLIASKSYGDKIVIGALYGSHEEGQCTPFAYLPVNVHVK